MKVWEEIRDGLGNRLVFELGGMGLLANHVDDWDPGTVGSVTTFATVTDPDGEAFSPSNPRLPAIWKFFASTGPCAGQEALDETVVYQNSLVPMTCVITRGPASYGFLTDGTPVYTGGDDKLFEGDDLYPADTRTSADGRYRLQYQYDGNLVLVANGTTPVWASNTSGTTTGRVAMQTDGNLVIYNGSNVAVWASNTAGYGGASVVVQSNRCALMYHGTPNNYTIPWGTSTCQ